MSHQVPSPTSFSRRWSLILYLLIFSRQIKPNFICLPWVHLNLLDGLFTFALKVRSSNQLNITGCPNALKHLTNTWDLIKSSIIYLVQVWPPSLFVLNSILNGDREWICDRGLNEDQWVISVFKRRPSQTTLLSTPFMYYPLFRYISSDLRLQSANIMYQHNEGIKWLNALVLKSTLHKIKYTKQF
jgi:hypothetical protein